MGERLNYGFVYEQFEKNGFELLSKKYNRNDEKLLFKDKDGYFYYVKYATFMHNMIRKSSFGKFERDNPKVLENMALWLKLNNSIFELIPNQKYNGVKTKYKFKCKNCPSGENPSILNWNNVLNGHGCGICKGLQIGLYNNFKYKFPEMAKQWDYKRNKITPEKVSPSSKLKYWWKCKVCGNSWFDSIVHRTYGQRGCSICSLSDGSYIVFNYLNNHKIKFKTEKTFDGCKDKNKLRFDFYVVDNNACIEYQGIQHYKPIDFAGKGKEWAEKEFKELKKRDRIKKKYCKQNNIKLIIIPYTKFNQIEQILKQELGLQ